ncbi:hypothetical protein [Streptomyces sp. NPDC048508]|uniref:hypothetical protein n=1 Tax=Streptomyces sp. NPDC048508 TaxID=3365561 RepID=UPI00371CC946
MGGDCWTWTGPYQPDLAAAFRRAQEEQLAQDDHGFPGLTVEELWRDPEWHEYVFTGGTGSVLDQAGMIDAADRFNDGPYMRPLTDEEIRAFAPDGRPTVAVWRAALDDDRLFPDRAQARCTVLHTDGEPTHIAYWGVTAD